MGGSSDQTIGHKYFLGIQMSLAYGPLDQVTRIEVDRRIAWEGINFGTSIEIDAPELFGGEKREGGISGTVDIDMGLPTQGTNSYLESVLGTDMPAFRGVACAVLNQCYVGNNPYLKPWSFRAQRIYLTSDGNTQWYSSKAGIGDDCVGFECDKFGNFLTDYASSLLGLWPLYTSYAEGGGPGNRNHKTPALIGDDAWIAIGADSYFGAVNILDESCYTATWIKEPVFGAQSHEGVLVASTSSPGKAGFGILHKRDAGSGSDEALLKFAITGGTFVRVSLQAENASGDLELYFESLTGGGTATHTIAWADIGPAGGLVSTDAHWYHLTVSTEVIDWDNDPYPYAIQISASAYVDGYAAIQATEYKEGSVLNPATEHTMYWGDDDDGGYHNWAYWANAALYDANELDRYTEAWNWNQIDYSGTPDCTCADMNPAHIIYECLTDTNWGMGYAANDIDETAFMAAADTLYDEQMGISLEWKTSTPLEDFVATILQHIDGVLYVDRTSGKFVLNLIRDDYQNDSTLVVLDESTVASVTDAKRPTAGELTSSVTVKFWDKETGEDASVTEHNWPLIQLQGAQTHTTIQYPGFTNYTIAQQVALRDLTSLSTPLLSCKVEAGRIAAELNVGDAFILDWPDLSIDSVVMRVQQMTLGDNRDNTIVIEAVEDTFRLPVARTEAPEDGLWTDPTQGTPLDSVPRVVMEAPYYEVVRVNGQLDTDTLLTNNNGAGFILAAGGRQGNEFNANLQVDSGSGYVDSDQLEFSPYAYLTEPITETDTVISITEAKDLDLVASASIAQIGDELVRVDSLVTDSNGNYVEIVVGRGILDTVPAAHGIDSNTLDSNHTNLEDAIIFWDQDASSDDIEYSASESVSVKIQTIQGDTTQTLANVPLDSITFNSRAYRPYPAGNLQIDGEGYPEDNTSTEIYFDFTHLITWAHRDRTQQTDGNLYDYTTGDIGPEVGTTYRIDIYSTLQDGSVTDPWWTTIVNGNSYQMDSNTDTSRGEPPSETETVHIKVTSMRDGYDAHQSPVATLSYLSDSTA